ncbi:hypothetical protein BT96DRAFT_1041192, partial [Gymnopus androsaceus JB14]
LKVNSVLLVTGCSTGGIGTALKEFVAKSCKVYATARNLTKMEGFSHPIIENLPLDVASDK